jgi:hypothetical protein
LTTVPKTAKDFGKLSGVIVPRSTSKTKKGSTGYRHIRTPSEKLTKAVQSMGFIDHADSNDEEEFEDVNDKFLSEGALSKVEARGYHVSYHNLISLI